jgi:hypothetical protein
MANPDKSLVVAAVEKVPAPQNKNGKHGHAVKRRQRFFAGNARIAALPAATGAELGAFLKDSVAARSHLLTDGFAGYPGQDAALGEHLKHTPVVQDEAANAGAFFPPGAAAWKQYASPKASPGFNRPEMAWRRG